MADFRQADQPSARVVENGDPQHQQDEPGIPPAVENVAREKQDGVQEQAGLPVRSVSLPAQDFESIVEEQEKRQKVEDEEVCGENHDQPVQARGREVKERLARTRT